MKILIAKLEKITVNTGIGRQAQQPNFTDKILPEIISEFGLLVGQKPSPRQAKKSIAGFKIREGTIVGLKATLRGKRMADFLERLVKIVLPRVRDFRGVDSKNVDQNGNLTIGVKEHIIFPEINPEQSKVNFGVQATIVPKRLKNRDEAMELYKQLGIPFKK